MRSVTPSSAGSGDVWLGGLGVDAAAVTTAHANKVSASLLGAIGREKRKALPKFAQVKRETAEVDGSCVRAKRGTKETREVEITRRK